MIINFSPVFADDSIVAFVAGDKITINDQEFDFTPLQPGFVLPLDAIDSTHFAGPVVRQVSGELEMTLRLPHPNDAPEYMRFPEPIHVTQDGLVLLPVYVAPEPPELSYVPEPEPEQDDGLLTSETNSYTSGAGSLEQEHRGDPVPTIDGLDGDPAAGDPEADPGIGNEEAGGSPVESDRGIE